MAGLGGRLVLLQEQLKKTPCKRCKLLYNHRKYDTCPHCGHLDETGLQLLLAKKARGHQQRKSAAKWFFVLALIIVFLIVLINLK
ncbi:MAG: hypothetical protein AAF372_01185 [Pseudomonadota bacterium]